MYMLEWTKQEVDQFLTRLILNLYSEFCYKQRDQALWEAGWETILKIPVY